MKKVTREDLKSRIHLESWEDNGLDIVDVEAAEWAIGQACDYIEELEAKLAEHKRLHGELNEILHAGMTAPTNPSLCDLVAYVKSDIDGLRDTLKKTNKYVDARRIEACEAADALGEKNLEIAELRMKLKKYEEPVAEFEGLKQYDYANSLTPYYFEMDGAYMETDEFSFEDETKYKVIIIEADI